MGDRSRGRTRRPPISFSRIARSEGYTNAANVWAVSLVQGPFSVAPCANLCVTIRHRGMPSTKNTPLHSSHVSPFLAGGQARARVQGEAAQQLRLPAVAAQPGHAHRWPGPGCQAKAAAAERQRHDATRGVGQTASVRRRVRDWVTLRARWVTLRARWVTLGARWVTLRARWVTLGARWVTLRARWVTLGARWVTLSEIGRAHV